MGTELGTSNRRTIVIATNNQGKAKEIAQVMDIANIDFITLKEAGIVSDPEENASDFVGNARIKARAAFEKSQGLAVLADDSGLEVFALDGRPGVYSARYAGDNADDAANNAKLLEELDGYEWPNRGAQFVCTLVFIDENGDEIVTTGEVKGKIGFEPKGDEGFGYDPLFYPDELGGDITFAEAGLEEKNQISHRARAVLALKKQLETKLS